MANHSLKLFDEQVLPSADEAARAIIATAIMDPEAAAQAVEMLTPDDFRAATDSGDLYAPVFQAIASLADRGQRTAPALVEREMRRLSIVPADYNGGAANIGAMLADMAPAYTVGVAMGRYCEALHWYGLRRRLRLAGMQLKDLAQREGIDAEEYTAQAEAILAAATARTVTTDDLKPMGEVLARRLEVHKARQKGEFTGLCTGFHDLDDILRGMQPGDLIVLAGRPSMGKTTLAQNIADNVAAAGGVVDMVSREMSPEQLADRLIASEGGVNGGLMRSGLIDPRHWATAEERLRKRGYFDSVYLVDDSSATVPQIRAKAIRLKRRKGLDLIVIDYLQLLSGHGVHARSGNKVNEVGEISKGLKALARELAVPVIALSQLSRSVEQRDDKRPVMSDLRESGSIEQDADVVAFLYRDEYYNPESPRKGTTELIIRKHRNGPLGVVELGFIPERTRFTNLDRRGG